MEKALFAGGSARNARAILAGGCFWCTEAIFKRLKGVKEVNPGYSGGDVKNPSYEEVCNGTTGHAEVIEIKFDPSVISYEKLLEVFFYTHNPTTPNQQGSDIGKQYRSAIFFVDDSQKKAAEKLIKNLEHMKIFRNQIVTSIEPFKEFYIAENYHKNYFDKNKQAPYCNVVIASKLKKLLDKYGNDVKKEYKRS